MSVSNEDRKYILKEFLRGISHISDKEYQKRVWIRAEGPECDDFTETVCHFFEESDGILLKSKEFGLSKSQKDILEQFYEQFDKFVKGPRPGYLAEEFVDSPEWEEIMAMAKEVLKAFESHN